MSADRPLRVAPSPRRSTTLGEIVTPSAGGDQGNHVRNVREDGDIAPQPQQSQQTQQTKQPHPTRPARRQRSEPPPATYDDQGNQISENRIPQNQDAEQAVLGSLLIDPESIARVRSVLEPKDFASNRHQQVYAAALEVYQRDGRVDLMTLCDALDGKGQLEEIGGPAYLTKLIGMVPTAVNVEYYAAIVERHAVRRRMIVLGGKIAGLGYEKTDADELVIEVQREVLKGTQRKLAQGAVGMDTLIRDFVADVEGRRSGDLFATTSEQGPIVPTGYIDLDELTGGLHPSDVIIVAARPGIGKSAMAFNIAVAAGRNGLPGGIFSLEMSKEQVALRMIAAHARLNVNNLRLGSISDDDFEAMQRSAEDLSLLPIQVDDQSFLNIMDIVSRAQRWQYQYGIKWVMVDYLQLLSGTVSSAKHGRQAEVSEISRYLKQAAKMLNVPFIVLAQLNRQVEHRKGGRPQLSDLRESGAIEQDADMVIFLHHHNQDEDKDDHFAHIEQSADGNAPPKLTEVIVAKHRNGPTGSVKLLFDGAYSRFDAYTERYQ